MLLWRTSSNLSTRNRNASRRAGGVCYHDNSKLRASIFTKLSLWVQVVTVSSWLNFGGPVPSGRGSAVGGILALPYYSHRGLCASTGGMRQARSVCVSLSAFSFINCSGFVWRFPNGFVRRSPDVSPWYSNLENYYVAVVPFPSFLDSSRRGIVERHVQCAQSPMHLVKYAARSGNSRLHSSMNFRRQKIKQNTSITVCKTLSLKLSHNVL